MSVSKKSNRLIFFFECISHKYKSSCIGIYEVLNEQDASHLGCRNPAVCIRKSRKATNEIMTKHVTKTLCAALWIICWMQNDKHCFMSKEVPEQKI